VRTVKAKKGVKETGVSQGLGLYHIKILIPSSCYVGCVFHDAVLNILHHEAFERNVNKAQIGIKIKLMSCLLEILSMKLD
jgi:hypothetical protein